METEVIAHIYTDFPEKFGIPRQSNLVEGARGKIVFTPKYRNPDALRGIEEYDYLWLLWDFSKAHRQNWAATVAPPRLGGRERMGVFSTRSPYRPNSIGLSSVRLERLEKEEERGIVLYVSGIDMLNGTPILDIKPYLPYTDAHPDAKAGFGERDVKGNLTVDIPKECRSQIDPNDLEDIYRILQQDPRTAFIHDEERVWGVAYGKYNVRFTVKGEILTVREIEIR